MGLTADAQAAIKEAFDTSLADAVKSCIYRRLESTFDPATNTTTDTATDYNTRGVFGGFKDSLVKDESVLDTKVRVLILQSELDVNPAQDDLLIVENKVYTIEIVMEDEADVTWILKCRQ